MSELTSFSVVRCFTFVMLYALCRAEYSVRTTNYGSVKGTVSTTGHNKKIEKFFGIPYARPPVGELRLEPPEPPIPWGNEIRDALELPPACPQPTEGVAYIEFHVPGFNITKEDCLYLNIYVPRNTRHKSLPVLVFIHGGSYQNGMGAMFDGSALATHGIVVVTFNYRLGALGFLTAVDDNLRGNYGMLDMVQALTWVRDNIVHFNGDPNQVTIDGHSAGGCSVGFLLMSPLAKGLFHRVIQQSGSPLGHWSVSRYQNKPNFIYKMFTMSLSCHSNSSADVKKCIQSLNSSTIENVIIEDFEWSTSLTPQYRPVVDGYFIPKTPEEMIETGPLNAQEFMTGATKDEGLIAAVHLIKLFGVGKTGLRKLLSLMSCFRGDLPEIPGIVDAVLNQYIEQLEWGQNDITDRQIRSTFSKVVGDYFITAPTHKMADKLAMRNVSVYVYTYEYKSLLEQWEGVIHGAEIFYLSGCPFEGHKNFRYNEVDKEMSKIMLLLWSNFVKHGVPSLEQKQSIYLPRYYPDRKQYSRIYYSDRPIISTNTNFRPNVMSFWNEKIPEMLQQQIQHRKTSLNLCTFEYSEETKNTRQIAYGGHNQIWILTSVVICLSVLSLVLTMAYYKTRREVVKLKRQSSISSGERMLPERL